MHMANANLQPQIVTLNGRPKAVILDIQEYERLLQAAEDRKDINELKRIKKGKTNFREFKDYLAEGNV